MSFVSMATEIRGAVPKLPFDYAKTLVNRAYADIRRQNLWSFLLFEGIWVTPGVVTGTASITRGSNVVTLNAATAAALTSSVIPPSQIIQRQFRVGTSGFYNISAVATTVNPNDTLTLDRVMGEGTNSTAGCSIFQSYYAANTTGLDPITDFLSWVSVRDMTNFVDLFTDRYTRAQLDAIDPQRTWYFFPTDVVPYKLDSNTASPSYNCQLFELWGVPQSALNYQLLGLRRGLDLSAPSDTLPPPIGEDCVTALARMYAYEWAEANKGTNARNQGPDFRYLMGAAKAEYDRLYKDYRRRDRETVDNFFSVRRSGLYGKFFAQFNSVTGTAYPGVAY